MNRVIVAFSVAIFFFLATAQAQQLSPSQVPLERIDRLETSLQIVRDYNDDFLNVVLWSLTAVFGLAVFLVGASWFQSNRILRSEVEALRSELHGLVETRISEVESPLREKVAQAIEEQSKAIDSAASAAANRALVPLASSVHNLQQRLNELKYDALEAEVEKWLQKRVLSNALSAATKMVATGVSMDHQFFVDRALDRVDSILNDLLANSKKLDAMDANETERILQSLGDPHMTARNAILEKLRKLQLL